MANSKVLIEVIATSKGLKVVAKDTEQLVKSTKKLDQSQQQQTKTTQRQTAAHTKYDKQNKSLYQNNLSSAKSFSKMKETMTGGGSSSLVAAYATLAANVFAATAAFNALKRASEINTLIEGFSYIARESGRSAMLLAEGLREATGGALSLDAALRAAAIGSTSGFTADQMERLATVAKNASIALGRDLADATDRLFRGVAKIEPEILDELGILVRLDSAAEAYGATLGKTATELSDFERRTAFLNATLLQGELKYGGLAGIIDPDPFQKLSASFTDLTRELLNLLNVAVVPLANVLANNTGLLLGTLILFASTIVKTMFPVLTELGQRQAFTASQTLKSAKAAEDAAKIKLAAAKKEMAAIKAPLTARQKAFNQDAVAGKTTLDYKKQITSLKISETKRANALKKYSGEHRVQKQRELEELRRYRAEVESVQRAEQGRSKDSLKVKRLEGTAGAQRGIAGGLERIGQSTGVGGFKEAQKEVDRLGKRLKVVSRTQGEFIKTNGKYSFTSFGAKAKFGFKLASGGARLFGAALINAIPLIGQIIFAIGLLIEFGGKLIKRNREQYAENNRLAVSYKTVTKGLDELADRNKKVQETLESYGITENSYVRSSQLANSLKFTSGAIGEFADNVKKVTEDLEKQDFGVFDILSNKFGNMIKNMGEALKNSGVVQGIKDFGNTIGEFFVKGAQWLGETTGITKAVDAVTDTVDQFVEENQRDLKLDNLKKQIGENNPIKLLEQESVLGDKVKAEYEKVFGKGGIEGYIESLRNEMKNPIMSEGFIGPAEGGLMSFGEISDDVNKKISNFQNTFADANQYAEAFSANFTEASKKLSEFQKKARNKNEFAVMSKSLKSVFDTSKLTENGLLSLTQAQNFIQFKLKTEGVGSLETYGITAENVFDNVAKAGEKPITRIQQLQDKVDRLAELSESIADEKKLSAALQQVSKSALAANLAMNKLNAEVETFSKTGKFELTPKQELDNAIKAAELKKTAATDEYNAKIKIIELETEFLLLQADLNKKILGDRYENTVKLINAVAAAQRSAAGSALASANAGANSELLGAVAGAGQSGSMIDRAGSLGLGFEQLDKKEGEDKTFSGTQARIEAIKGLITPMQEELAKLGPEGEFVNAATSGILTVASAFTTMGEEGLASAKGLEAAGAMISAISNIMASQAKAQVAEVDKQIEAEKKRDGKSAESISKIRAMEKQKEAIQKKAFERNKKMQMAQTVINTASAIVAVLDDVPAPYNFALAALVGAMGMAQLAIIKKSQFQSSAGAIEEPKNTALSIGKRSEGVDISKRATGGELNYLRGGRTTGSNIGGAGASFPGAAMGRRGYADGGVVVGERGPEVITPTRQVDVTPNYALGTGTTNVNFSINAVDAAGVEDVLMNQRGNIIRMIREAANENGERFLEDIDTQAYGSSK